MRLRYLNFCPDIFDYVEKRLDKKAKTNFKFLTPQTGWQVITIHILPNISRSKDNQTMKLSQVIGYNIRKFILGNHTQNVVKKLVLDPFLKIQNRAYLWINWTFIQVIFVICPNYRIPKYIKVLNTCFYSYKGGFILPALFFAWFLEKNISHIVSY